MERVRQIGVAESEFKMQKFDSVPPRGKDQSFDHEPLEDRHNKAGGRTFPHSPGDVSSFKTESSCESGNSSDTYQTIPCVGVNTCSVASVIERAVRMRKFAIKAWVSASDIDGVEVQAVDGGPKSFPVLPQSFSGRTLSTSETISFADNESEVEGLARALSSFRSWYQKDFVTDEVPWFLKDHEPLKLPELVEEDRKETQYTDLKILGSGDAEAPSEGADSESVVESVDVPNSPENVGGVEIEESESHSSVSAHIQKSHYPIKEAGSGMAEWEAPKHGAETLCNQGEIQEELQSPRAQEVQYRKLQSGTKPEQTIPCIDCGVDTDMQRKTTDSIKLVEKQRKFESIRGSLRKVKCDLANVKHAVTNRTRIDSQCCDCHSYCLIGKVRSRLLENLVPCNPGLRKQRQKKTNPDNRPSKTRRFKVKFCSGSAR